MIKPCRRDMAQECALFLSRHLALMSRGWGDCLELLFVAPGLPKVDVFSDQALALLTALTAACAYSEKMCAWAKHRQRQREAKAEKYLFLDDLGLCLEHWRLGSLASTDQVRTGHFESRVGCRREQAS